MHVRMHVLGMHHMRGKETPWFCTAGEDFGAPSDGLVEAQPVNPSCQHSVDMLTDVLRTCPEYSNAHAPAGTGGSASMTLYDWW